MESPKVQQMQAKKSFMYTGWLIGILIMVYYNPYKLGSITPYMTQPTRDFFIAQFSSSPFPSRCSDFQVNNLKNFSFVSKGLPVSIVFPSRLRLPTVGFRNKNPRSKFPHDVFVSLYSFSQKSWKWKNGCIWKGTTIWRDYTHFSLSREKWEERVNFRSTSTLC